MVDKSMEKSPKAKTVPTWIKLLLGMSLALNLAVAGIVVGAFMRGAPGPRGLASLSYATPYVLALPSQDRKAVFRELRRGEKAGVPSRAERRALFYDMIAALNADPYDDAAVVAILQVQGDLGVQAMTAAQSAWLERVRAMDTETRKAYSLRVEEMLKRKPKRKKRD